MRILAIRGNNITSLSGEFKLELDKPPLAGVGLFSITGPTGSGKSSLLDALCLALFGTAPRLDGQGHIRFGREDDGEEHRLGAGDPRSLIRRGTTSGFAEVDYVGEGGYRYRARWEARRARDRITGRFQDWTVKLENVDTGEILGHKKTDVLKEIERTLGLSYQQFRRSALLAQGDFAAFLQERGDERAKLLEQMTGSDIYKRISKAAYDRAKAASLEFSKLESAADAVPTLPDEARRELEEKVVLLTREREARSQAVAQAEVVLRFFDDLSEYLRLEKEAEGEVLMAKEAHERLSPLRAELAEVERALPLRALVESERGAISRKEAAEARRARAEQQVATANQGLEACRQRRVSSEALRQEASQRLERARPELERASRLDALIAEKNRQCEDARAEAKGALSKRDDASRLRADLVERIGDREKAAEEARGWLTARASVAPLEAQWEVYRAEFRRYADTHREAKRLQDAIPSLERADEAFKHALAEAEGALSLATAEVDRAKLAYESAEAEARLVVFSEKEREERDVISIRQKRVERLAAVCTQIDALARREAKERASEASSKLQEEEARRGAAEAEGEIAKVEAQLSEAKRAFEQTRAALDLEGHRAQLREGEPCPLCGSGDHPYAQGAGPMLALLEAQEARVSDRDAALRALYQRMSSQEAVAAELSKALAEAGARLLEITTERERLTADFVTLAEEAEVGEVHPDPAGVAKLTELAQALGARLVALREAERQASERAVEAQKRQKAWQRAREEAEAQAKAREVGKERAREANVALSRQKEDLAKLSESLEKTADTLAPALEGRGDWRAKLAEAPEEFAERRAKEVSGYRAKRDELVSIDDTLAKLRAEQETTTAIYEERATAAAKLQSDLASREAALLVDKTARAALFEGRATEAVQRELEVSLERADVALAAMTKEERDAEAALAGAHREKAAAETEETIAREALTRASGDLAAQLERIEMKREALEAHLQRGEAWVLDAKKRTTGADLALQEATVRHRERSKRRETHEGRSRPAMTEEEARSRFSSEGEALQTTIDALADSQARLKSDAEARALKESRKSEKEEAQKTLELWKTLDNLIGSADGKKFRTFAQSLTLDALVAYANEHLRDLAPRYRLMRVPGHDMELQIIDCDMADEIRGTNSLSGGETFLVSLALALSLSSLAARDVRIDTLFIDEGFGSLDPSTLDVAISALESLQATGRQVGVISHVRAMADKIGTQVRVQKLGAGKSRVLLEGVREVG